VVVVLVVVVGVAVGVMAVVTSPSLHSTGTSPSSNKITNSHGLALSKRNLTFCTKRGLHSFLERLGKRKWEGKGLEEKAEAMA
jgi:hypothetical protein